MVAVQTRRDEKIWELKGLEGRNDKQFGTEARIRAVQWLSL